MRTGGPDRHGHPGTPALTLACWARRGSGAATLILLALLQLGGCANEAADLGKPPPVALSIARRELLLPLHDGFQLQASARVQLHDAVVALGGERAEAVRARIRAADAGDADAVRRALLSMGVDPARIVAERLPRVVRLWPGVTLTRTFATTTACGAAIAPALRGDPLPSLDSLGRCVAANNLAAMLVDPADLVNPPALDPADASFLLDGLRSRSAQRGASLPGVASSSGPSGSGDSYGGGAPAAGRAVAAPLAGASASPAAP